MGRGHTKSRFGCRECKQRHVKCDESRPSCVNCTTVKRHCSFLTTGTATPLPRLPPVLTPENSSSPASADPGQSQVAPSAAPPWSTSLTSDRDQDSAQTVQPTHL
ncbi:hypothetical protein Micbo1qcDRAFT_168867, partial [Microdochium bolleyi]